MAPRYLAGFAATSMLAGCEHVGGSACVASPQATTEIENTVHALFDALRNDDKASFQRLTTTSFYAFDGGKRYAGTELVDLVRDAHARGIQLNWSIGPLDTKIRCDVAWSAWENFGSAGPPTQVKAIRWLESAVLVHQGRSWKIDFFHSQRAAPH
jgi:hypothetical protein